MGISFSLVDVFAEKKYEGNQLAVVRNKTELSEVEMQRIAREINFSETTFVLPEKRQSGSFNVRIFTPKEEVPFAGHPTLGTAYVIQQELIQRMIKTIKLNLKVGQIPVTLSYKDNLPNILWMQQKNPDFGKVLTHNQILGMLGIPEDEIDLRFPIQEVTTGLPCLIIPLKTLEATRKVTINTDAYFDLIRNTTAKLILVFCPQTYNQENALNVRVFGHYYGIQEDPATGSGNGCLAGYLVRHRYFGKAEIEIRVEQGYEIGRPSLLFLRAKDGEDKIDVHVGGKVIMVAQGEFI